MRSSQSHNYLLLIALAQKLERIEERVRRAGHTTKDDDKWFSSCGARIGGTTRG